MRLMVMRMRIGRSGTLTPGRRVMDRIQVPSLQHHQTELDGSRISALISILKR
jgi:hypothetical protein